MSRITDGNDSSSLQGTNSFSSAQAFNHQRVANLQNSQQILTELRAGVTAVQEEHNVQQVLLLLRNNANLCFKFINMFQESYNTVEEKKEAVKNVGILASLNPLAGNSAKDELNNAEGAHKTIKGFLTSTLHELTTAFTSFSAAIGSIKLRGVTEGQVTTVISNFETHIRDLTDEVSKTSNVQIKKVEEHEAKMRSLLEELSDKLKLDANDRLEAQFIKKQKELLRKMQTYVISGNLLIDSTFDLTLIKKTLPQLPSSSQPSSQPPPQSADGKYLLPGDQLSESVFQF